MAIEVVTKDDLQAFKAEILAEIKLLLHGAGHAQGRMLKSFEVKELLNISTGTLHKLRQNGTLPYAKRDGLFRYKEEDVKAVLQAQAHSKW